MLKPKHKIFLFSLHLVICSYAQINLVPNPSFEQYSSCPDYQGEIYKVDNWINFGGSPDYSNVCASSASLQSVPQNWGFQYPASGNGYIDLAIYENVAPNAREYVGAQLIAPLITGTRYYISFKTSPIFNTGYINYFTNNLGLLFTTYPFDSVNSPILNYSHLRSSIIITDTTNWTQISGSLVADSNYKYVVLGNFYSSNNTLIDSVTYPSSGFRGAYYYYDDIIVTTDSTLLNVNNPQVRKESRIYPNPTTGKLFLETNLSNAESFAKIFSSLGDFIIEIKIQKNNEIDLSFLSNGIYLIEINSQKESIKQKLIINH